MQYPVRVYADAESTLLQQESLVEIARRSGKTEDVESKDVMNGYNVWTPELQARSLQTRCNILNMSHDMLLKQAGLMTPTPGSQDFVEHCRSHRIPLTVVSGGINTVIWPILKKMGIHRKYLYSPQAGDCEDGFRILEHPRNLPPKVNVFSKKDVINYCKRRYGEHIAVVIGDGANDVSAGDINIAFTGVVQRPKVVEKADTEGEDFPKVQEIISGIIENRATLRLPLGAILNRETVEQLIQDV